MNHRLLAPEARAVGVSVCVSVDVRAQTCVLCTPACVFTQTWMHAWTRGHRRVYTVCTSALYTCDVCSVGDVCVCAWTCANAASPFSPQSSPRLGLGPFPPGLPAFSLEGKSHLRVFPKQNEMLSFLECLWKRLSPFYFLF